MTSTVKNEDSPVYNVVKLSQGTLDRENDIIKQALGILESRLYRGGAHTLNSPGAVRDYLQVKMCQLQHEVFAVTFLDAQHRTIAHEEMFTGTLTQCSAYPREVVKAALKHNAAAVIFSHNHPSGVAEPSQSDRILTSWLPSVSWCWYMPLPLPLPFFRRR